MITPSDIVVGGRYKGGKVGRIRVVHLIRGPVKMWVWWHWNGYSKLKDHCEHIDMFCKWATEKLDEKGRVS